MKFTIAYYLMLLYLTVMFKPLIPVISDAWSHAFDEQTHIATIHAKYGKNHLEHELANKASDNDTNKAQNTLSLEDQVPLHVSTCECKYDFSESKKDKMYPLLKLYKLPVIFISNQFPPPKFSC